MRILICLILLTGCDYVIPVRPVRTHISQPHAFKGRVAYESYTPPSVAWIDPEYKTISSGRTFYRYDRIWLQEDKIWITDSTNGMVIELNGIYKLIEGE